jgi:scyllo-inositol 2-dehydrogenase (NADP+)
VAIVGFGLAGRVLHAPLIQAAGLKITAVVSSNQALVERTLPHVTLLPNLEAALANPTISVIVITTPNHLHATQAMAALRAGKCVVVDKPLATNAAEAEPVVRTAEQNGTALTVFQNRRWDSDFLTTRELLRSGQLGTLRRYEANWDRHRPEVAERWRERADHGGGLLLDLGSHLVDQALQLFGTPDWVAAELACRRIGASVEDEFAIQLGYAHVEVCLGARSLGPEPRPRFHLQGTSGTFVKSGLDVQEAQLRAGQLPLSSDFGIEPKEQYGLLTAAGHAAASPVTAQPGHWLHFYQSLKAHLRGEAPLPVAARDALLVLQVLDAARRSATLGSRVSLHPPLL